VRIACASSRLAIPHRAARGVRSGSSSSPGCAGRSSAAGEGLLLTLDLEQFGPAIRSGLLASINSTSWRVPVSFMAAFWWALEDLNLRPLPCRGTPSTIDYLRKQERPRSGGVHHSRPLPYVESVLLPKCYPGNREAGQFDGSETDVQDRVARLVQARDR